MNNPAKATWRLRKHTARCSDEMLTAVKALQQRTGTVEALVAAITAYVRVRTLVEGR